MDILEFYKKLSLLVDNHRANGNRKSTLELKKLIKEAKEAGLEIDINEDLFSNVEIFYEESSYEEDSSYNSYEEDEDSSYDDY